MADYKPNSHRFKEEQSDSGTASNAKKEVKKVINGTAKVKKKSSLSKVADTFINEDVENVKSYILMDVLVPAAKKAISDIVVNGIDMILYGEVRDKKSSGSSYVSYNKYSSRDRDDRFYNRTRSGYSHDDIILDTRREAEEILRNMDGLIETYGVVSVADLYDLAGVSCSYTDNKYGWSNIRNAEIIRVRDGYIIKMPKAMPID